MIAPRVYFLCAATSFGCTGLLLRGYSHSAFRLLLWSAICFLTIDNVLLFVDLVIVPETDLLIWRHITAAIGTTTLLVGLIWDTQ